MQRGRQQAWIQRVQVGEQRHGDGDFGLFCLGVDVVGPYPMQVGHREHYLCVQMLCPVDDGQQGGCLGSRLRAEDVSAVEGIGVPFHSRLDPSQQYLPGVRLIACHDRNATGWWQPVVMLEADVHQIERGAAIAEDLPDAERRLAAFAAGDYTGVTAVGTASLAERLVRDAAGAAGTQLRHRMLILAACLHHCRALTVATSEGRRAAKRHAGAVALAVALEEPQVVPMRLRPVAAIAAVDACAEFQRRGLLDLAITAGRVALRWGTEATVRAGRINVGAALGERFEATGDVADLDEAIELYRTAAVEPGPLRADLLNNLGTALLARFGHTRVPADIDDAVGSLSQAASGSGSAGHAANLAQALTVRYEATGDLADLTEAVRQARLAVNHSDLDDPDLGARLSGLGSALRTRFEATGDSSDLDESLTAHRRAVAVVPAGHPRVFGIKVNLGNTLRARYDLAGAWADLDEAITVTGDALATAPAGHPGVARYSSNLGAMLRLRFQSTGARHDLDAAVKVQQQAVSDAAADDHYQGRYLSNLAGSLLARFERFGAGDDLNRAVLYCRRAATFVGQSPTDRARCLSTLAGVLQARFDRRGAVEDIDEAVTVGRQATELVPVGHIDRPRHLTNLSLFLQARFTRTEQDADLDEAISTMREAVAATPPRSPTLPVRLSNMCVIRQTRYLRNGDLTELDAAIVDGLRAVDQTDGSAPERHSRLSNVGLALLRRFERTRQPQDLDDAVRLGTESVAAAEPGSPGWSRSLVNLGSAYEQRATATDLREARDCWWCAASAPAAPVAVRTVAGAAWGRTAARLGARADGADGYATAVRLLAALSWPGVRRVDREYAIAGWSGLARDAAATATDAGRHTTAVTLLEAGRAILWAQILDRRADLTVLRSQAPKLAASLDRVRSELDGSEELDQLAGAIGGHRSGGFSGPKDAHLAKDVPFRR
nr:tetratricopeptide repeat protein [Micromonospora sp. CMU55-4]